uniref:Envelope protein n=1 Tax=Cyanistes caeruleus TaxID=156563 RepID=A0A8C0VP60_CYACU
MCILTGRAPGHFAIPWTVIAQTVSNAPSFIVHISDIFNTDGIGIDPSQGKPLAYINWGTYWCPSVNPGKSYCTYPGYGFCGYWGCETIVTSNQWTPARRDSFLDTVLQPQDTSWSLGRKWSVFLHSWDTDPSTIVQIIRASPTHHTALGPNRVVAQQYNHINSNPTPSFTSATSALHGALELTSHALFHRMLNATFLSLNATKPDLTRSCWLCYNAYLPFYEGVALNAMFSYNRVNDPKRCLWNTPRKGITLEQVSGKGVCIGNRQAIQRHEEIRGTPVTLDKTESWVIPAASGIWACSSTGITPCVSIKHFDETNDFCVQVVVIPRILYFPGDELLYHQERSSPRRKRELIAAISLTVLLGLGATGAATGVSALVTQNQGLAQLQTTVDEDLHRIQESISDLERSLNSLAEVVLQNRRGLDILLMHQGGLCAALDEKCCFYANYSGPIKQSVAELQQRLEERSQQHSQQNWFSSMFNQSPWIITLVSTLAGPVIVVVFVLIFGPCLLNKLAQFIKTRLDKIDILYLEQSSNKVFMSLHDSSSMDSHSPNRG